MKPLGSFLIAAGWIGFGYFLGRTGVGYLDGSYWFAAVVAVTVVTIGLELRDRSP